MQVLNTLQKDYTQNQGFYQLKLPLNIECKIPKDNPVRLLSQFVEGMDLTDLYATYSRIRENQASPRQLLKVVLCGYMNHHYSSRDLENICHYDIRFLFLLEGWRVPDHATFARFITLHFALCSERILAEMSNFLYDLGEITGETIFIDGTKIESCANKYTFVWKKAITKNMEKRLQKIADFVEECEKAYGLKIIRENKVKIKHLKKLSKQLYRIKQEEQIQFVHGCGKRKTPLQRSMEQLGEHLEKLKEYTKKLHICGDRNSYSKTDPDATFMRMKEDAMGNGQLKPGYNLQHGVDSGYVTWLTIGPQPTDTTTLIPFLESAEEHLRFKYKKIVADAGYESEENYLWLENNEQLAFIKPTNYEISKTRTYQKDSGRIENMSYDAESDCYWCKEGKKLSVEKVVVRTSKTGYESEKTIYKCEDCQGCASKEQCIKGRNWKLPLEERVKRFEISKRFNEKRKESLKRITSLEGCQLRMNRSIQAEGSFADIKDDMGFRRYLRRGSTYVKAESILLAMARNLKKLHHKIQGERLGTHLYELKPSA